MTEYHSITSVQHVTTTITSDNSSCTHHQHHHDHKNDDISLSTANTTVPKPTTTTNSCNHTTTATPIDTGKISDFDEDYSILIDNRTLPYIPILLNVSGILCMCRPEVIQHDSFCKMLQIIDEDIQCCLQILPVSVHNLLYRTKIWLNVSIYQYGPKQEPITILYTTSTHHSQEYLVLTKDNSNKCYGIEMYDIYKYCYEQRNHYNGNGGLLLHEYCHIIHQHVLQLNNPFVYDWYETTRENGKYNCVLRRDWYLNQLKKEEEMNKKKGISDTTPLDSTSTDGIDNIAGNGNTTTVTTNTTIKDHSLYYTDLAYCMVNEKEFFSELSVTYWSRGYEHLNEASPNDIKVASPPPIPFHHYDDFIDQEKKNRNVVNVETVIVDYNNDQDTVVIQSKIEGHCNTFYPFTAGQFQFYDPILYEQFRYLWDIVIENWSDPELHHHHPNQNPTENHHVSDVLNEGLVNQTGISTNKNPSPIYLLAPLPDFAQMEQLDPIIDLYYKRSSCRCCTNSRTRVDNTIICASCENNKREPTSSFYETDSDDDDNDNDTTNHNGRENNCTKTTKNRNSHCCFPFFPHWKNYMKHHKRFVIPINLKHHHPLNNVEGIVQTKKLWNKNEYFPQHHLTDHQMTRDESSPLVNPLPTHMTPVQDLNNNPSVKNIVPNDSYESNYIDRSNQYQVVVLQSETDGSCTKEDGHTNDSYGTTPLERTREELHNNSTTTSIPYLIIPTTSFEISDTVDF